MNELIVIDPSEFGLEESKATELTAGLTTILTERAILVDAYNDVLQLEVNSENLPTFKDLRLRIRDNRTKGIEKWHKVNKEFFLTGGRFVDAIKNRECAENERMEGQLMNAEKHFENIEKERMLVIHKERVSQLAQYNYNIGTVDFAFMDENMFNAILTGAKKNHEDQLVITAKIEADRKAQEAADIAMRIENERLKQESIDKEREADKILAIEREKSDEALRLANESAARERAKAELLAKVERDRASKALEDERAKAELLAKELKKKQDIEAAEEAGRIEAAKAPDKDKLYAFIKCMVYQPFDLTTPEAAKVFAEINVKLEAFKVWANSKVDLL